MAELEHNSELEQQVKAIEERVLLMRSLEGRSEEECRLLADETLADYCPLAERIGLQAQQSEMQEAAMKYGYPEDYRNLKRLLQEAEASCELVFKTFRIPICSMLESLGIEFQFIYRMKSVYSIWRKIKKSGKTFDDVYDLFATRIIYKVPERVKPLTEIGLTEYALSPSPLPLSELDAEKLICWRIYTVITALYRVQPDRIRDWITHPKPSGYQAMQMTCMGPDCNWVEIQIRSERMDYEAEHGIAAHWKYKAETALPGKA